MSVSRQSVLEGEVLGVLKGAGVGGSRRPEAVSTEQAHPPATALPISATDTQTFHFRSRLLVNLLATSCQACTTQPPAAP